LERELLDEQEQGAMVAVARAKRTHGTALQWDDKLQIDKRYNRVGMEKTTSGVAFADLNNNVIVTGTHVCCLSGTRVSLCAHNSDTLSAVELLSPVDCHTVSQARFLQQA
jgi:acyl-CoA thioesterase FadM